MKELSLGKVLSTVMISVLITAAWGGHPPATFSQQADAGDATADIVIVGSGISGLSAAWEAGQTGARVHVIDMWSIFGGHGVAAGGVLNMVATPVQEAKGIQDNPDLAFNDFMMWGEDPNSEWVRYYVDNSKELIHDWLMGMGIGFGELGRNPGNTVPRVHRTQGGGLALVTTIYRECLKYPNITFAWNHKVTGLLKENNRVVGVEVENLRNGEKFEIRTSAVILATGGFQSNLEMVREFWPENLKFPERLLLSSGIEARGSGLGLAQEAGAKLDYLDHQWNYSSGIPDPRYPGTDRGLFARSSAAIWVNMDGQRFVNESDSVKMTTPAVINQKTSSYWAVFDAAGMEQLAVRGTTAWKNPKQVLLEKYPHVIPSAASIKELAQVIRLEPDILSLTVDRYNSMVEKGEDEDFDRFSSTLSPAKELIRQAYTPAKIEKPPFYALHTFAVTRKSLGGVLVDLSGRVLDGGGQPIPGLYAVGEVTGFGQINGKAGLEGTFLGPAIVTGRVGGREALAALEKAFAGKVTPELRPPSTTNTSIKNEACLKCHPVAQLIATQRPGYLHFERAHRIVLERNDPCIQCHGEFDPTPTGSHQFDRLAQVKNCFLCH